MFFITKFARVGVQMARQVRAMPLAAAQWRSFHVSCILDNGKKMDLCNHMKETQQRFESHW